MASRILNNGLTGRIENEKKYNDESWFSSYPHCWNEGGFSCDKCKLKSKFTNFDRESIILVWKFVNWEQINKTTLGKQRQFKYCCAKLSQSEHVIYVISF